MGKKTKACVSKNEMLAQVGHYFVEISHKTCRAWWDG
jgi:hypothetical protein